MSVAPRLGGSPALPLHSAGDSVSIHGAGSVAVLVKIEWGDQRNLPFKKMSIVDS